MTNQKTIARVAKVTVYALTLCDHASWKKASDFWRLRLPDEQRAALAWAALKSLEPDQARQVFETAHVGAGYPDPAFMNVMSDARWWASLATSNELKAYCVAAHEAMQPRDQEAFLVWASENMRVAA